MIAADISINVDVNVMMLIICWVTLLFTSHKARNSSGNLAKRKMREIATIFISYVEYSASLEKKHGIIDGSVIKAT